MVTHGANQARKGGIKPNTQAREPDRMVNTQGGLSDLRWLMGGGRGGGRTTWAKEWSPTTNKRTATGTTHSGGHPSLKVWRAFT